MDDGNATMREHHLGSADAAERRAGEARGEERASHLADACKHYRAALAQTNDVEFRLRQLCSKQQSVIEDLNGMADAVEVLRDIGRVVGCGHVDGPDERSQLVNCVEQAFEKLQHELSECQAALACVEANRHNVGGCETL